MTDKPILFRGPMIKIKRRTVKVGGGRLYADHMGQVEMKVSGVSLLLENVLFVPGLGVNLLSSRKLCTDWNCLGIFNDKSMWFISENKQVVLQANIKGGLYIISRILPGMQGIETAMIGMLEGIDSGIMPALPQSANQPASQPDSQADSQPDSQPDSQLLVSLTTRRNRMIP